MNYYHNTFFFFILYDLKDNFKESQRLYDNKYQSFKQNYNVKRLFRALASEYSYYDKKY